MKALIWKDGHLSLGERDMPQIHQPTDAIVRVTAAAICTSDLHIIHGAVARAGDDIVLGHEFVGEVVAVGDGVSSLKPGDHVAANCITFCGDCWYCRRGYINNCMYGGWELGCRIDGCQAEYVRVPFAQQGLTPLPKGMEDKKALFVGDILSSGYFGAELCDLRPGDSVAVIGAGPVGMCAMQCARLFGAATVIAIDINPQRLEFVKQKGLADQIILHQGNETEGLVKEYTSGRGADGVIEAAGGIDSFETAWKIARPNATVALIAMYEQAQTFPLHKMYGKNLIFKTGGVDAVHCKTLVDLLEKGRLNTDFLISHEMPLERILKGYQIFEQGLENCIKICIVP